MKPQDMEFLKEDGHVGDCVRASTAMVVMDGIELAHDPHPSRDGIVAVDRVYLLTPKRIASNPGGGLS